MLGQRREQLLARTLLHVERTSVADRRRYVHEAVLGRFVGDTKPVGTVSTDAQSAERKYAGLERTRVQLVEQRIDLDCVLDIRGVFDDQVRHA
jgi:hypothetical protein